MTSPAATGRDVFRARLEDVFFFGVIALAAAPVFAMSAAYWCLLLIAVVFVVHVAAGGWRRLRPAPLDLPVAAFLICRILSTVTSVTPLASWKGLEKSGLMLAYYPLAHMALGRSRRLGGIYLFLAAVVVAAVVGSADYAFGSAARVASRTTGYTTFAEILAVAICLLAGLAAFAPARRIWAWGAAALAPAGALVLTFCRGQWLALAAGVGVVGVLKDRRVFALLLVVAAFAAAATYLAPAGLASGRFSLGDPAFENYRDILWKGGLDVAFARPLTGFGPGTIKAVFPYQTRFYSPVEKVIGWHNDFLQLAVESGLVTVAAALWLLAAAIRSAWRSFRRDAAAPAVRGLGVGLLAATAVVVVSGLVGNVVTDPAMITVFCLLWGLYVPLGEGEGGADA